MKTNKNKVKLLIIGLGNPLAGDDGFGPYVIKLLEQNYLPPGVEVLIGGTDAFFLLPYLQKAEQIIIIDVVQTDEKPGTLYQIPLRQLTSSFSGFGQHDISLLSFYQFPMVKDKLSLPDGVLYAVEAEKIDLFSEELNPLLKEAAKSVILRIMAKLENIS